MMLDIAYKCDCETASSAIVIWVSTRLFVVHREKTKRSLFQFARSGDEIVIAIEGNRQNGEGHTST